MPFSSVDGLHRKMADGSLHKIANFLRHVREAWPDQAWANARLEYALG